MPYIWKHIFFPVRSFLSSFVYLRFGPCSDWTCRADIVRCINQGNKQWTQTLRRIALYFHNGLWYLLSLLVTTMLSTCYDLCGALCRSWFVIYNHMCVSWLTTPECNVQSEYARNIQQRFSQVFITYDDRQRHSHTHAPREHLACICSWLTIYHQMCGCVCVNLAPVCWPAPALHKRRGRRSPCP